MTRFYSITPVGDGAAGPGIAARHEDRIYLYLAATELWHRSRALEEQFRSEHRAGVMEEVPAPVLPTILAGLRAMHRRSADGLVDDARPSRQPTDTRTSAELGILTPSPAEPSPTNLPELPEGLPQLLAELPLHAHRVVARFPLSTTPPGALARHLADAITAGALPGLMGIPLLATRTFDGGHEIVTVTRVEVAERTVDGRPRAGIRQTLLHHRRVFSHVPDEELVTLAAQTCGDSLDGSDMELSMLVLAEVERRSLLTMVIAHRAERLQRSEPHLSQSGAATRAARQFAHWRDEFYAGPAVPHPRDAYRRVAEIAILAEDTIHDWPLVAKVRQSEIVEDVLTEFRNVDTGELDIDSAEQLLRTRADDYLSGPGHAAWMAKMHELQRENDDKRTGADQSS